jgi:predicted dehydrogenase
MKNKIIAIIGLGPMGQRHLQACKNLGFDKIFLCDLNIKKILEIQNSNCYKNWKKLITEQKIDFLIISSTADSHYHILKFALLNGIKKILCEKPITNNLAHAMELVELSKIHKAVVSINHIRRWSNSYIKLKKILNSKRFGGIRNIYFEMGGGQLASNGGHLFDLSLFLTDAKPLSIFSKIDHTNTPHPRGEKFRDPGAFGILQLSKNIRVFFDMMEDYGTPTLIKILCKFGNIIIDEKNKEWRLFSRKVIDQKIPLTKRPSLEKINFKGHGMINMVESSQKVIINIFKAKSSKNLACNIQDGYNSLEIAAAAHYSSKKNKEIKLPIKNKKVINKFFKFT